MKLNTNAIHNILNIIGLVVAILAVQDWTTFGFSIALAGQITAYFLLFDKIIKLSINVFRDGIEGLFSRQPPVVLLPTP